MKEVKEVGLVITDQTSLNSKLEEMQAIVRDGFLRSRKDRLEFVP